MNDTDVPIVIVGGGPVGLTLACELSHHRVPSMLIERNPATTTFPKMDIINARSMELLRRIGASAPIAASGVGPEYSLRVVFASSLAGRPFAEWDLPSPAVLRAQSVANNDGSSPREPWLRVPQSAGEAVLMERCLRDPLIDVRRPWRVTSVESDSDGVQTTMIDAESGDERAVRSRYVVGCDGAHSAVRKSLGIAQEGQEAVAAMAMVHFRSRDLDVLQTHGQYWHEFFALGGAIIAQDEIEIWTVHAAVPPDTDAADLDPRSVVTDLCGRHVEIDEVLEFTVWRPNVLIANHYQDGPVFLAGDACHQVIPTGGYGLNTGFGDAVDLGWKLAALVAGWGGEGLARSYEAERRPVGLRNRDWSFRHMGMHLHMWNTANPELIDSDTEEAVAHRRELAKHVLENRGENESWGIELGYCYEGSPIVIDEDEPPVEFDPMNYRPTTRPGIRAPHVFLRDGTSIIDHFHEGFSLVESADDEVGQPFADAAVELGVPLARVKVKEPAVREIYERDLVLVRPDGHVAWRGDTVGPEAISILARVTGQTA